MSSFRAGYYAGAVKGAEHDTSLAAAQLRAAADASVGGDAAVFRAAVRAIARQLEESSRRLSMVEAVCAASESAQKVEAAE
jgi:hypothetical protein